ncbi:MAG TPA: hypothetical protein VNX18_11595 [Bryobacteraceae bacterium]|jgi:hypothetical protein|nr:hypothetical protein [Bryobacteraceae bacterium]
MAVTKPRNRVVIFRLTQDEYRQLETISSAGGARSLSDFARSKILGGGGGDPSLAEIAKKLDELQGVVQGLERILGKSNT